MEAVRFTLSGRTAFFKKPEVNAYYYFTYSQIHKIALMGMFGAILGYGGYAQKNWQVVKKGQEIVVEYPEFYEKLRRESIRFLLFQKMRGDIFRRKFRYLIILLDMQVRNREEIL